MTRRWPAEALSSVAQALGRARAGQPTVFVVEGEPGAGKSALLEELISQAADFHLFSSQGWETGAASAYAVLAGWGVDLTPATGSDTLPDVVAGQRLREVVDGAAERGPVLLVLDDLHWADPESVSTVLELLRRAAGDHLLLAASSRPLPTQAHPEWQRWTSHSKQCLRVSLTGLLLDDALVLARELRSDIDPQTAEALWKHTGGNPLYLQALLAEYEVGELAGMQVLPAPASFAQSVARKLSRLPDDAVRLAQAAAVLGSGWSSILDVSELAGAAHPADALQSLTDAGLLEAKRSGPTVSVRPAHALVRSAIYQHTPIPTQRQLHAHAATLVTSPGGVLDHRVAAAEQYDDELAAELEGYAAELHSRRSYRLAAHYWSAAGALSRRPNERENRHLESLFDTILSGDRASAHAALDDAPEAGDRVLRALIEGMLAIWERHPFDGAEILGGAADAMQASPQRTQYRVAVLLAWSRLQSNAPTVQIQAALNRAASAEPDPAVRGLELIATGVVITRSSSVAEALKVVGALPEAPAATPQNLTSALSWRGSLFSTAGRFAESTADLLVVTDRVQKGQADVSGGSMHALLGRAQWFSGQWPLARVSLRTSAELTAAYPHPMVAASTPLIAICDADFEAADDGIRAAREILDQAPWQEAVDLLTITELIRFHAQGAAPTEPYERLRVAVRGIRAGRAQKSCVWSVHAALAALWAHELGDAEACVEFVRAAPPEVRWVATIAEWLLGLIAEARGKGKIALGHLRAAVALGNPEMPLYRAHALLDHARLAHLLGDAAGAARSLEFAAQTYQSVGAGSYLERVDELRRSGKPATPEATIRLSDRERDVLTLVADGLSYAQIARDLFITQSTVSYHLGNIYAKADVSSRHQLTALVRADPRAFGLGTALRAG